MIFIEESDERNKHVMKFLINDGIKCESFTEDSKNFICSGDYVVFSPAKKFTITLIDLPNNITIFCGNITDEIKQIFNQKQIRHYNFLENEEFAIKNANLTAEGVLAVILENSTKSVYENNILILGSGRLAKAYAILFGKLGLKYSFCTFRNQGFLDYALFSNNRYFIKDFCNIVSDFDIVVNTVPEMLLTEVMINHIAPFTLFLETASKNCLDKEKVVNFKYLLCPALPQKFSAQSAGKIVYEIIKEEING